MIGKKGMSVKGKVEGNLACQRNGRGRVNWLEILLAQYVPCPPPAVVMIGLMIALKGRNMYHCINTDLFTINDSCFD